MTYLKNLVKCAAPTIVSELSWGKHVVRLSNIVYGTITEVCRYYANCKLILDSRSPLIFPYGDVVYVVAMDQYILAIDSCT